MEALPTKGKEAPFFTVNGEPSKDQMLFVYQYYPQYSFNPVDILTWCFHEANRIKQMAAMANVANDDAYGANRNTKSRQ